MFENEPFNDENQIGYEQNAFIIGSGAKTIIYGLHGLLSDFERHLENISTRYKYMALTWLLASYAGIGSLLSTKMGGIIFNHFLGICIISFIGFIGVTLLWHLDMNVYHRFWSAVLAEEVIMEKKYPFLLQSRRKAFHIDEGRERVFSQGLLYIIANTLLLITMAVSLSFFFNREHIYITIISISFILIISLIWKFMINVSNKIEFSLYEIIEVGSKSNHPTYPK
jgi:hypothetical protein